MPEFRSLASILLEPVKTIHRIVEPAPTIVDDQPVVAPSRVLPGEDTMHEMRLFRAHLREALDRAVDTVLERIAREILLRELLLGPAEIANVVADALRDYEQLHPLRVRVHPHDVAALSCIDLPVFADESLVRGDAFLDLRHGCIDLTITNRLDDLLATAARR